MYIYLHSRLGLLNTVTASLQTVLYDTKQSDGEVPVMMELWAMQSTPSLLWLLGPLWPGKVASDRALFVG